MDSKFGLKSNKTTACANFSDNTKKLSKPTLNSTLRHEQQIKQLHKAKFDINSYENDVPQKFTMKLNFGANQKVFKNLTPINVNDSLLMPKEKLSIPKKYDRNNDKIPTPDLNDFLEIVPPHIFTVEEPEIKIELMKYEFDVMSNYKEFLD